MIEYAQQTRAFLMIETLNLIPITIIILVAIELLIIKGLLAVGRNSG